MARLCGVKTYPKLFLHMACVESIPFAFHGKNQYSKVKHAMLDRLHIMTFMSIKPDETIYKHLGKKWF
jgi:hypothetical protein